MTRYLKQRDQSSCGPVAVINALKWAGLRVTEKTHKKKIQQLTQCNPYGRGFRGSHPYDVNHALSCYNSIKIQRVRKDVWTTLSEINEHLDKGGSILMRYFLANNGHYTLCVGRTPKTYRFVNDSWNKTVIDRSQKRVKEMLSTSNNAFGVLEFPVIWFLTRR